MVTQPILSNEDLILRPFVDEDAPRVQLLAGDQRIAATTATIPHPYPDGAALAWISQTREQWASAETASFAITLAPAAELAGAISLMNIKDGVAELGYWVGAPYWGRGIATCAARCLIDFGLSELGLRRIHARCLSRNPASGKVLLRCGFTHTGTDTVVCGYQQQEQETDFYELLACQA
jgi:ribosomal-protein-alanine N-acetyltransferase